MADRVPTLVILAGGSSSRLWPLREKSLIRFMDRPLLEHQLNTYVELGVKRVVVICNADNQADIEQVLTNFGKKGQFWETTVQHQPRGMGDALLTLEPVLLANSSEPVPVYICQVHDIFQKSFHQEMFRSYQDNPQAALLASYEVDEYFPGGYLVIEGGAIKNIIEKPHPEKVPSNLVNIVAHIHPDLRRLLERVKTEYASDKPGDDHYERAMATLMPEMTFEPVPYNGAWHPIKYPWHVLEAMHYFLSSLEPYVSLEANIEKGVNISGPVHIEAGVRIFHGADIRGPVYIGKKCLIGQNAIVRDSMISEDTIVGAKSEVNRSYLGRGTRSHDAMILDTVVADSGENGQHTNLSARMVTANFRADGGPIKSTVKGERINTGRTKFGAVIGAGSFIGIGVETMPGIKIGENCFVGASTLVPEDVPDNSRYYVVQAYVRKEIRPEKS
jgi:NDP-sugar pyrophosphorylase family protein